MAAKKKTFPKKKLEEFEQILLEKRAKIVKELAYLESNSFTTEDAADQGGYTSHLAEEGSDFSTMETNFDLIQREGKFLVYIEEALERIKHGTYGICKVCDELIEEDRLKAVPTTSTHVECKEKIKVKEKADLEKEKIKEALARQSIKI